MTSNIGRRRQAAIAEGGEFYHARRREIIEAAAQVFRAKGYAGASLGDIAAVLGTDRASLYYYFASKQDLFAAIVEEAAENNVQRVEDIRESGDDPRVKIRELVKALMLSYADHYPHLFVYMQEKMAHVAEEGTPWGDHMAELNRRYDDAVMDIVQEGIDAGCLRQVAPPRIMAYGIVGMVTWTHRWFRPDGPLDAEQIGDAFATMLLDGIAEPQ